MKKAIFFNPKAESQTPSSIGDIIKGIPLERFAEICEAERYGRCGVCPVKLHQHIYRIFNGNVLDEIVCSAIFEPFTPRPRWKIWTMGGGMYYWYDVFGKTVFLTREAAEAALKGESNGR